MQATLYIVRSGDDNVVIQNFSPHHAKKRKKKIGVSFLSQVGFVGDFSSYLLTLPQSTYCNVCVTGNCLVEKQQVFLLEMHKGLQRFGFIICHSPQKRYKEKQVNTQSGVSLNSFLP